MALSNSLLSLIDPKLEAEFNRSSPDASKARARALKTIETARKQFASVEPTRGRKAFRIGGGDVVSFSGGYKINDLDTVFVPANRFNDFLNELTKSINAGELDAALIAENGDATLIEAKRTARDPNAPRRKNKPRDPAAIAETNRKREETRQANRAAKAGGQAAEAPEEDAPKKRGRKPKAETAEA